MDKEYQQAKQRVSSKKKFFKELGEYVSTSVFLVAINVFTSPHTMWSMWVVGPWGFVLVMKALKIAFHEKTDSWERREMRKELRSMGRDPDEYDQEYLELKELDEREMRSQPTRISTYKKSDLV